LTPSWRQTCCAGASQGAKSIRGRHGEHRPLTIDSPLIPCSLPDPSLFLDALPGLLSPDGVVAIVSPYSWLEEWTPRDKWLGGLVRGGDAVYSAPELTAKMEALGFVLVEQSDMPFVIREHGACDEPRCDMWPCCERALV
jgi:hypothetical protein